MKLYRTLVYRSLHNCDSLVQMHLKQRTRNDPADMNLHFSCIILCFPGSCSHRPRSISCWFTMLMPFSMIKNTVMLHVSTAWHCNRRRSSAKHPKSEHLRVELQPTCKRRYRRKDHAGIGLKFRSAVLVSGCQREYEGTKSD